MVKTEKYFRSGRNVTILDIFDYLILSNSK